MYIQIQCVCVLDTVRDFFHVTMLLSEVGEADGRPRGFGEHRKIPAETYGLFRDRAGIFVWV